MTLSFSSFEIHSHLQAGGIWNFNDILGLAQ